MRDDFYRRVYILHKTLLDIEHNVTQLEREVRRAQDDIENENFLDEAFYRLGRRAPLNHPPPINDPHNSLSIPSDRTTLRETQ